MIRQYSPQRFRYAEIGTPGMRRLEMVGTLPVGTIFRSTDEFGRTRKLMIEAWQPRELGAGRWISGRYTSTPMARMGHLALCRDLRNGRRITLADHFIRFAVDHD